MEQLATQIQEKAIDSQQQLRSILLQVTAKERSCRIKELAKKELDVVGKDAAVYGGVGKMFIRTDLDSVRKTIDAEISSLQQELDALRKKKDYHETTAVNANSHLQKIKESVR
ncbi:prefoldin subunit 1 [Schizosaccharomyces cryophilus OY26]|uniref:Prefoldin subunit 1 n=1 Tax=Schizosaccharomyces cryophilus (strain OY26 / ATCC MYA-4695 / CBS 11777 / NBRC 106824 / NRRL Y48691) TaxID=653667 RepID=S9W310_SCHCR|nr:prefoldin subunit 1 [Schizosaccharomyces cryophilus OY26]EPY52949.1 prefoldin subunit 1 [Schizosaccharomyces cryophilus OY26]